MGDTMPTEEVTLVNNIGNNIPVHISSRRGLISPSEISTEQEEEANKRVDHNNCQLYTGIVTVGEEYVNRMIPRSSYSQNNVVLRELPIPTGKSDSDFTEEDEDVKSMHSSREEQYESADISQGIFFSQDNLIEKGIIKIIARPETGPGEDSSCYDPCSHGLSLSSADSNCNNSDKENQSPFQDINSSTISTPATYKHSDPSASKNCQIAVEMVESNQQCPDIKKEILSQNSTIYEETLDTSSSVYSKMSSPVSSFTSGENSTPLMVPNSFDSTRLFGHSSLSSSARESNGFSSENSIRNFECEESSISQKNDFPTCYTSSSCGQNSIDLGISMNNKDITSGFMKSASNSNSIAVENSLNLKKCAEDFRNNDDNTFSSSPTSSCESSPFTSILGNDSRYQDQITAPQMSASRLLGYCQDYDKETPRSILSRMQGVDLFINQPPFLKSRDIRTSHMTSTPLYKQQKLQETFMEMPTSHSQKTSQHSNQILHTPHPKHGQLIYCHSILDGSTDFQAKTPMSGPILNSSGEENSSPEYMPCTSVPFNTPDNEDRVSLACLKSDLCHEDDPIRHQHNLNERKRRARITIACDLMRRLVPGLSDKTDQATVFEYAARYIHFLQTQVGNKYNRNFLVKYSPYKLMEIEKFLP